MTTSELGLRSGQRNENVHNEPQSHFVPVEGGFVDRSAFEKYQTAQIAARMILAHSIILNQRQIMQITALDILHQEAIEEADARLVATVDLTIKTTYLEFLKSGNVIGKYKRPYTHHSRNKNLVSRILFPVKGKSSQVRENPEPGKNKSREKNRGVLKSGVEEESRGSGDEQRGREKK